MLAFFVSIICDRIKRTSLARVSKKKIDPLGDIPAFFGSVTKVLINNLFLKNFNIIFIKNLLKY